MRYKEAYFMRFYKTSTSVFYRGAVIYIRALQSIVDSRLLSLISSGTGLRCTDIMIMKHIDAMHDRCIPKLLTN